ncbi:MAG: hypothetical protein ACLFVJ_19550, partial [Persicimonas sp.]
MQEPARRTRAERRSCPIPDNLSIASGRSFRALGLDNERRDEMAKEKFERTKPHLNVGTIGHVDHGKTTL